MLSLKNFTAQKSISSHNQTRKYRLFKFSRDAVTYGTGGFTLFKLPATEGSGNILADNARAKT